jgi:hypothetical protein
VAVSGAATLEVNGPPSEYAVRVLDAGGRGVPNAFVQWSTFGGAMVAPVTSVTDPNGVARTSVQAGTAALATVIRASSPTLQGVVTAGFAVLITPGPAAALTLSGGAASLGLYAERTLAVQAKDAYGNPVTGIVPTWASADPAVVTVTAAGLLQARAAGTTTVIASAGALQTSVSVTVRAAILVDDFDGENGGVARLSDTALSQWVVARPDVDLIGRGSDWDFAPGNGLYLDLDGYYAGGRIESRDPYRLPAGSYTLRFSLAGSQRGDENTVTVSAGSLLNESFTRASGDGFVAVTRTLTVPAGGASVRIAFDQQGSDGYGALLDAVSLVKN